MRVLHVAPSVARAYGGPAHSLGGYVRAARAVGAHVDVFAPHCPPAELASLHEGEGAAPRMFRSFGRDAFIASPALWAALLREGRHYDVLHVHGLLNPVSSLAARIAVSRGWPLVIRPFGMLSAYTFTHRRRALKRAVFAVLDRPNLRTATAVHFTTEGERDNAAWHGLAFGPRAFVIPPPFTSGPTAAAPALDRAKPVILCLARLNRVKSIESLIGAMPAVLAARPAARLVIAGDGDAAYARELRSLAERLGVAHGVDFAGFVTGTEKRNVLARSSVFALPSQHENFGLALLEALGAGLPAVVTPEVQLAEFVKRHQLGIIASREPAELAAALLAAIDDEALQARCRSAAPALVTDTFSEQSIGTRLVQMYESATSRS